MTETPNPAPRRKAKWIATGIVFLVLLILNVRKTVEVRDHMGKMLEFRERGWPCVIFCSPRPFGWEGYVGYRWLINFVVWTSLLVGTWKFVGWLSGERKSEKPDAEA